MALWNLAFYLLWCTLDTSLVFSKIQEILLAHIAIISDSPTLHLDTNNQNLPGDKDYRSDPPPGYPISPLDGCYAETQASAGCQLTRLSRHKPQTFATLPGIWHSWYLADNQLISGLWSLLTHSLGMAHGNTHHNITHHNIIFLAHLEGVCSVVRGRAACDPILSTNRQTQPRAASHHKKQTNTLDIKWLWGWRHNFSEYW